MVAQQSFAKRKIPKICILHNFMNAKALILHFEKQDPNSDIQAHFSRKTKTAKYLTQPPTAHCSTLTAHRPPAPALQH